LAICFGEVSDKQLNCKREDIKEIIWNHGEEFIFLSPQQLELVDFLARYYITPIHNALRLFFPRNLFEKISKQTLWKIKVSEYKYKNPEIILSEPQGDIYKKITTKNHLHHLIYGVTGSGKTQIYMKLIQDAILLGRQSLLLIPEIILTSQIGERIQAMFWDDVLIIHSGVTAAKKAKYWMDIHSWNAKIIIGTRSSLFYPYNNLWCIIIDEEHDSSYISDSAPRYHSLDVAQRLSQLYDIPLILGSGTPRTTTLYKWLKWDFQILQLLEKYSD
jgi:primosomal protein N' (replication factor Y)